MSGERHPRQMAQDLADMIHRSFGDAAPGMLIVLIANEADGQPGRIELDAAFKGGGAYTPEGATSLTDFGNQMRGSIKEAAARVGGGSILVDRPDIAIPGPRGES